VLGCAFVLSFLLNVAVGLVLLGYLFFFPGEYLSEQHHSGNRSAAGKVAIIHLDGIILEGLLGYVHRQIHQAAHDNAVKAVVLRINSPGGTITASDDLHQRLTALRDGEPTKKTAARPLVVSMGSLAASGGYYVAMPAQTLFAERATLTGSIGVYASLPNVKEFADRHGVHLNTIKAGEIKNSASPFAVLSDKERQVWQDLVDHAYLQFLQVVERGRPHLSRSKLLQRFQVVPLRPDPQTAAGDTKKEPAPYSRYRADGGIFTADKAKELQLVDKIGTLDDAVAAAAAAADLGDDYRAVRYARPMSITSLLLGTRASAADPTPALLDPGRLESALAPRLWYLAPGYEAAGLLAAGR
jgi:protease-4